MAGIGRIAPVRRRARAGNDIGKTLPVGGFPVRRSWFGTLKCYAELPTMLHRCGIFIALSLPFEMSELVRRCQNVSGWAVGYFFKSLVLVFGTELAITY